MKRLFLAIAACFCVALGAQAQTYTLGEEISAGTPLIDGVLESALDVDATVVFTNEFSASGGGFESPDDPDAPETLLNTFIIPLTTIGTHAAFLTEIVGFDPSSFTLRTGGAASFDGPGLYGATDVVFFTTTEATTVFLDVFGDRDADPISVRGNVVFIPEPATWLMMIVGFAVVGLQLRRRERQAVDFA